MDRPPYDHGNAPPPTTQPYSPISQQHQHQQQSSATHDGLPSHPSYPQYSYDIQMRYHEDPNRPYSQDQSAHPPTDVPRQYVNSPYANPVKDGPTSPYPKEVHSPYMRDGPTSPYGKENGNQFQREAPPTSPYPPMNGHYSSMPPQPQSPAHHHTVQLPPMSMAMQGHPHEYGPPPPMIMDMTGQVAPGGMKPRVTATLWEDEGTLCFQVDVKGTCVARREDNHMVNGTKLLNVAGMTRGRRDGILKAEKQKHVVKIGPMHLKGVWIPYDRALTFANKENITPLLYPLFVHNIGALLYHPINNGRAGPPGYPAQSPRRGEENDHSQQQQHQQHQPQQHQQQQPQHQYQHQQPPPLQHYQQPPPISHEPPQSR